MSLPRRGGKRRRSTSDSDSLGSSADRSDSRLLPSGPVLSPPPGLGRSWKDSGRPGAAAAGTPGPLGQGRGGQVSCAMCREVSALRGACLCARSTRFLVIFSVCDSGPVWQVTFCSDKGVLSAYLQRPRGRNIQVFSGSCDLCRNSSRDGHISSPFRRGLAPKSAQYSLQILTLDVLYGRCALYSFIPTQEFQSTVEGSLLVSSVKLNPTLR